MIGSCNSPIIANCPNHLAELPCRLIRAKYSSLCTNFAVVRFVNHEYDYRLTMPCYQLIIAIKISH